MVETRSQSEYRGVYIGNITAKTVSVLADNKMHIAVLLYIKRTFLTNKIWLYTVSSTTGILSNNLSVRLKIQPRV